MLLTIITVSFFALGCLPHFLLIEGSDDVIKKDVCYGRSVRIPFDYVPTFYPKWMYFTPSKGGSRRIMMENGEAKDPRLGIFSASLTLKDLTERDDGTFSVQFDIGRVFSILKVKVLECAKEVELYYKDMFHRYVPKDAEFLEFTPIFRPDQPRVLWNRTDPQTNTGGRGNVRHNVWEISEVTQADNGFYNFRKKDKTLLSRIKLIVKEHTIFYDAEVGEHLRITYPLTFTPWDMTFIPKGKKESVIVMKAGNLIEEDNFMSESLNFVGRLQKVNEGIVIDYVFSTDSGAFEFRDQEGYLVLVVQVKVDEDSLLDYVYIALIFGIIHVMCCGCCYLKKRCCKKSSAKRESTPQTEAAPAVYYHDRNQPEGPSYSAAPPPPAYQPWNALGAQEPTREPTSCLEPPAYDTLDFHVNPTQPVDPTQPKAYNTLDLHVNPTQPEVAAPGGQGAAPTFSIGSDCLSSDSGPTFELKGVNFPSAPPLNSNSTSNDVYISDKLNFL